MLVHLYTTLGCHLCEDAKALLVELKHTQNSLVDFKEIEISESDELIEQYGIRIPVIKIITSGAELGWPFNSDQLAEFLTEVQINDS